MANLGYFQVKAKPGLWQLSLAPGRTRQVYRLHSSSGTSDSSNGEGTSNVSTQVGASATVALMHHIRFTMSAAALLT